MRRLLTVLVVLALLGPASARADGLTRVGTVVSKARVGGLAQPLRPPVTRTTLLTPEGGVDPWATFANYRSLMASPPVTVVLHREPCPLEPVDGEESCTWQDGPIYLRVDDGSALSLYHELGHHVDYAMDEQVRQGFLDAIGESGRPWRDAPNSPHEKFAEAYSACSKWPVMPRSYAEFGFGYAYEPTPAQYKRVCALMRREFRRLGWGG